ncbi:MAG: Glu/Leu/Phe/Val dehydrogenase dimerization domain-containing protein [Candidatus Magasanikbacteria bacterium]
MKISTEEKGEFLEIKHYRLVNKGWEVFVAIYNTVYNPVLDLETSLGGARIRDYENSKDALRDVKRLAKGMAYKNAIHNCNFGGAKAVINANPEDKSERLFLEFGQIVEDLGGMYITAEDIGTTVEDMKVVNRKTEHVCGLAGDPSPVTAQGVIYGLKACLDNKYEDASLEGLETLIQGVGKVGSVLAEKLDEKGAIVKISDVDNKKIERVREEVPSVEVVDLDKVFGTKFDIFIPCAVGGVINDRTIDKLNCDIVAGAANNPLQDQKRHAEELRQKDILYAPDYVINGGGLIAVVKELQSQSGIEAAMEEVKEIRPRLERVFEISERRGIPTQKAADKLAEKKGGL